MADGEQRQLGARGGFTHPEEVGSRIAQARKELGLSQAELANEIDVGRAQVLLYEAGRHLTMKRVQRIARVTGRPLEWFLHGGQPALAALTLSDDPEIKRIAETLMLPFLETNRREVRDQLAAVLRKLSTFLQQIASELAAEDETKTR